MRKKIQLYLSFIVALALPCLLFAQGNPSVTSFKVSGPFVAGSEFTITLGNLPDMTKLNPTVTLNGKALTVTGTGKTTISGKLTEGMSKKGGDIKINVDGKLVQYTLYAPFIENIFLPKIEIGAQIIINGGNFSEKDCKISLKDSSLKVVRCSQNQIIATLGNKLSGGDLTVVSGDLTSAPYRFVFDSPHLSFAENKEGVFPGSILRIHGNGFSSVPVENQIFLNKLLLEVAGFKSDEGVILVKLPAENTKGALKLVVNGIESNTISIDANLTPIVTDYKVTDSADKTMVTVSGKNFSSNPSDVSLSIGSKKSTVKFSNVNTIAGEFPRGSYSGCLMVEVYGLPSNCIPFNSMRPPVLKGFLDPIFGVSDNRYEWVLFAEGLSDKNDKISVYVNGEKATVKGRFLNRLTVTFDAIPDNGEVYVVSEGLESNRVTYDFGQRFYPFISAAFSNGKFMYGQPVTIQGNNLGQQKFRDKTKINISGVSLAKKDDKAKSLDWTVSPAEITIRLDDKVKKGTKVVLSVTVKGKKSNEVVFVTGQDSKQVLCSPWIQSIQYPEGLTEGSTIRILGQCFDPDMTKDWLYFDKVGTKATFAKNNILETRIPSGAQLKGNIMVKTDIGQSNSVGYVSSGQTPNSLTFSFEDLGTKILSEIGKEAPFAKWVINDTLGEVEMQTVKFKFVYEDDKNNPNSVIKLGPPPLGEIKVVFSGVGKKAIAPMVVQREGTNVFGLTLNGIRISPSTSPQSLEFRTTVRPSVVSGAKFHLEFNPSKIENFSGLLIQRDKQEVMKIDQGLIESKPVAITKTEVKCFDSDTKKANCLSWAGIAPAPVPAATAPTKPKLPKIPTLPK